jgi:hypothetical protein
LKRISTSERITLQNTELRARRKTLKSCHVALGLYHSWIYNIYEKNMGFKPKVGYELGRLWWVSIIFYNKIFSLPKHAAPRADTNQVSYCYSIKSFNFVLFFYGVYFCKTVAQNRMTT